MREDLHIAIVGVTGAVGDEARTGFADDVANNINLSASMKEKKKSFFAMLQKSTAPQDWEKEDTDSRIKSVVGKKD